MIKTDYIIVGQGLAGTALAFRLESEGQKVIIIDNAHNQSASKVSSGIMNPITGRRYVKSWLFDDLLPEAISFYKGLETKLQCSFLEQTEILRALSNVLEENVWHGQSAKPDYEKYFGETIKGPSVIDHFKNEIILGSVRYGHRVDMPKLMEACTSYFIQNNMLVHEQFDHNALMIDSQKVMYKEYEAKAIIFAEGWHVRNNPLFNDLPFDPTKGEVLLVRIKDYDIESPVKNNKFIVPIGDDMYWVGSTNEQGIKDERSNESKKNELLLFLKDYLNKPYEILDHKVAIRPATKQRKPFIGQHRNHANVLLFNGLGTKGVSLGPYFSKMLADHILYGEVLIPEVDISRYYD